MTSTRFAARLVLSLGLTWGCSSNSIDPPTQAADTPELGASSAVEEADALDEAPQPDTSPDADPAPGPDLPDVSQWEPDPIAPTSFDPHTGLRPACKAGGAIALEPKRTALEALPWERGLAMKYSADYEAFVQRAARHARPRSQRELEAFLDSIGRAPGDDGSEDRPPARTLASKDSLLSRDPESPEDLGQMLADGLAIEFLLEGLDERPLTVQPGPGPGWAGGRQLNLVLQDPYVGTMEVLLILPDGEGPWPAVVVHPGHFEDAHYHRQFRYGAEFAEAGLAMAILTPRANDSFPVEDATSQLLLRNGFTFAGLRVYELLLIRKYLRCRGDIQGERIGLMGHSGGAVMGNLAVRVERSWNSYVSDLTGDYLNWDREARTALDETAPRIHPLHTHVNDFETSEVPILTLPYGFGKTSDELLSFFGKHLQAEP